MEACPEQLIPSRLAKMADHGVADEFEKWHGLECIECGSCSFACPAKHNREEDVLVVGISKENIENPIIGPPEIIFSGCTLNPPAASTNSA